MIRQLLFTSNFKRKAKTVIGILLACFLFQTLVKLFNYVYVAPNDGSRIMWHDFYEQDNIDYLYLGSSHVYNDINPEVLDSLNDQNNFNMATDAQRIQESYYNLLEADKRYNIKKVYLELYYKLSTGVFGDYTDTSSIKNAWCNIDYMKMGKAKWKLVGTSQDVEHLPDTFLPFIRYREHLFEWQFYIVKQIEYKKTEDYINYKYYVQNESGQHVEWREKGFNHTDYEYIPRTWRTKLLPSDMYITTDAIDYLKKTIEYCQKNGIEIILFSSPIWETEVMATENYDAYVESVREIGLEYGVPYYDFNLCKEEYLPIQYPKYFMNEGHLNYKGAEMFTEFFREVVSNAPEDNEIYFYDTYAEKMKNVSPQLYGLYYRIVFDSKTGYDTRSFTIAASEGTAMEFKITLTRDDEEVKEYDMPTQYMVQDFSSNRSFTIPIDEHGICTVTWRLAEEPDNISTMEFEY